MTEEIFDVVNERDEVIGQRSRNEVHRLGLMHRAVHVLVFNSAGLVFLQKRSLSKDRQPGLWDSSASGHVDTGEDYDACAVRELGEEIGLQLNVAPQRLFKLAACHDTDQEHVWVYRCSAEGPFRLRPQNSPIEGRARRARSNSTNPSGGHLRRANLGPTAPRSDSSQTDLQFRTRGQPKHQLAPAPVWPHGLGLIDAVQHLLPDPP